MVATDPEGNAKVFSWFGDTIISVQRTDTYTTPIKS